MSPQRRARRGDKTRAALPNPKQRELILTFVTMKGGGVEKLYPRRRNSTRTDKDDRNASPEHGMALHLAPRLSDLAECGD